MSPILDGIADEYSSRFVVAKVNVHEDMPLAVKYNISSAPTFLVIKDGAVKGQFSGAKPKDEFVEKVLDTLGA